MRYHSTCLDGSVVGHHDKPIDQKSRDPRGPEVGRRCEAPSYLPRLCGVDPPIDFGPRWLCARSPGRHVVGDVSLFRLQNAGQESSMSKNSRTLRVGKAATNGQSPAMPAGQPSFSARGAAIPTHVSRLRHISVTRRAQRFGNNA